MGQILLDKGTAGDAADAVKASNKALEPLGPEHKAADVGQNADKMVVIPKLRSMRENRSYLGKRHGHDTQHSHARVSQQPTMNVRSFTAHGLTPRTADAYAGSSFWVRFKVRSSPG